MTAATESNNMWTRAEHVAEVHGEGHVTLLPLARVPAGAPRLLEGTAALIWYQLDALPRSEHSVIAEVAAACGMAPESIADAVHAFLAELEAQGLAARTG